MTEQPQQIVPRIFACGLNVWSWGMDLRGRVGQRSVGSGRGYARDDDENEAQQDAEPDLRPDLAPLLVVVRGRLLLRGLLLVRGRLLLLGLLLFGRPLGFVRGDPGLDLGIDVEAPGGAHRIDVLHVDGHAHLDVGRLGDGVRAVLRGHVKVALLLGDARGAGLLLPRLAVAVERLPFLVFPDQGVADAFLQFRLLVGAIVVGLARRSVHAHLGHEPRRLGVGAVDGLGLCGADEGREKHERSAPGHRGARGVKGRRPRRLAQTGCGARAAQSRPESRP